MVTLTKRLGLNVKLRRWIASAAMLACMVSHSSAANKLRSPVQHAHPSTTFKAIVILKTACLTSQTCSLKLFICALAALTKLMEKGCMMLAQELQGLGIALGTLYRSLHNTTQDLSNSTLLLHLALLQHCQHCLHRTTLSNRTPSCKVGLPPCTVSRLDPGSLERLARLLMHT
jgi:hypothetical protein